MTDKKLMFRKANKEVSERLTQSNVKKIEQMLEKQRVALEKFKKTAGTDSVLDAYIENVYEWIRAVGGNPSDIIKDTEKVIKLFCESANNYMNYLKTGFKTEEKRRSMIKSGMGYVMG